MEHSASIEIAEDDADLEGDKYGVRIDNTGFFVGNLGDSMTQHVYVTASGIQTESKEPNQVFTTDGKTVYLKTINEQEIYSNSAGDTNIEITASGDYLPTSGGTLTGKLEITGQGSGPPTIIQTCMFLIRPAMAQGSIRTTCMSATTKTISWLT